MTATRSNFFHPAPCTRYMVRLSMMCRAAMKPTTKKEHIMKIFHDMTLAEDTFANDGGYLMHEYEPTLRGSESIYVVYDHETAIDCGYSDEELAATEANRFRNFRVRA